MNMGLTDPVRISKKSKTDELHTKGLVVLTVVVL